MHCHVLYITFELTGTASILLIPRHSTGPIILDHFYAQFTGFVKIFANSTERAPRFSVSLVLLTVVESIPSIGSTLLVPVSTSESQPSVIFRFFTGYVYFVHEANCGETGTAENARDILSWRQYH